MKKLIKIFSVLLLLVNAVVTGALATGPAATVSAASSKNVKKVASGTVLKKIKKRKPFTNG